MKWFLSLDVTVQAALIGVGGSALIAVISGLFRIAKKRHSSEKKPHSTIINQTSSRNDNTFIGIQNNHTGGKNDD